jgi:hypothetical protein
LSIKARDGFPSSENLSLDGVEIARLKTAEAANQAMEAGSVEPLNFFSDNFFGKRV